MTESLRQYAEQLFGGEDPLLRQMREEAAAEGLPAIQVPSDLGRLLGLLVRESGAQRILEIGTLFGYSGTLLARALPADGRLVTLEANAKHAGIAQRNFERAGVAGKVELREGPALTTLEGMRQERFDLVFIDADKENYPAYLDWALRLTHPGALIVADNVWRGGEVTHPEDEAARAMATFNQAVARNTHLLAAIIPTRDCEDAAMVSWVVA